MNASHLLGGSKSSSVSPDYTIVQVLLLAGPTLLCLRIGLDPNAAAAVGHFPLIALAVLPAVAFASGVTKRGYGALPLFLTFLSCAILLSAVGFWIDYWSRIYAPDCDLSVDLDEEQTPGTAAYDENRENSFDQPARRDAATFYATCLLDLQQNVSGWPVEAQRSRFEDMTVMHCPGYAAAVLENPAFERLELREATFGCAGLCVPQGPIWTPYYEQAPACGPILSNFMLRTVSRTGLQAAVWSLVLVVGAAVGVLVLFRGVQAHSQVVKC